MNDVSVVIYSCDNYSDVWDPFFTLFYRYWDCPYFVYVLAETQKCYQPGVTTINTQGNTWTDRIRTAIEKIDTPYIIGMCEDFFLRRAVHQNVIEDCIQYMNDNKNIACFNFEKEYACHLEGTDYPNFGKKPPTGTYKKSCQPTLWRKDVLLGLLNCSMSPWEWEVTFPDVQYNSYDYCIWNGSPDDLVFEYGYHGGNWIGIRKGKWVREDVEELFRREHIDVDFTRRGFYGE